MESVKVDLTKDEALVLFEWLARNDATSGRLVIEDESERKVLWVLEGLLESLLVEPLRPDYKERLAEARAKVLASPAR
jgi:hypothetical protein